ncbi:hypothetical protein ACJMK2_009325 [Sinanodonta woodiana]|uniref:Uncharacterized protein n=1 Tax=Sinanodonta woodiana TaxID=1069815 RepID=A0ABD3VC00_SINWO
MVDIASGTFSLELNMAQTGEVDSSKTDTNFLSLQDVLHGFNSSINEEQAWAVCYQCSIYFLSVESPDKYKEIYYYGNVAIQVRKDGDVFIDSAPNIGSGKGPPRKRSSFSSSRDFKEVVTQVDAVEALGSAIYQALDYGLSETEEPNLSHDLEELIELMVHNSDDDEGIGIESSRFNDEGQVDSDKSLFQEVIQHCVKHCSNQQDALHHYKAVCRALVAEAFELLTFLDKMSKGREKLAKTQQDEDISLDELQRSDWARLWVQIMRELRNGVRLKKVEHVQLSPIEFELTPFEILLEDIRLGRFKLNRIMVDKRKMNTPPKRELDPIEKLMAEIRQGYDLRPVQNARRVVCACDGDKSTPTARKVIKPDFNLLLNNSFSISDEDSDGSEDGEYAIDCVLPNHMSPMSPVEDAMMNKNWKRAVARDLLMQDGKCSKVVKRRHSINVCSEMLNSTKRKWKNPIECLSLTLKEVTHIRMVLTKAELESLITDPDLYNLVAKGKVCFTCKKTRFGLFSPWGTKCKFCQRTVCNFCLRKVNVPTEHFEKIPVYTLSPIPLSQETLDMLKVYESTGSVPQSPANQRKLSQQTQQQQEQHQEQAESELEDNKASKRRSLQRSYTMSTGTRPPPNKALLKGPQMSICCDCKTMIMEIIRASRTSLSVVNGGKQYSEEEKPEEKKPEIKLRPRSTLSRSETVTSESVQRPKSMLNMPFHWPLK